MQFPEPRTRRREFLGQLAGVAVALTGTACATGQGSSPGAGARPTIGPGDARPVPSRTAAPATAFDDSWTARLTARHKSVYDSPSINDGVALGHASAVMNGYHAALGAPGTDLNIVIVIRHAAIPMALNDAMWDKYAFGQDLKLKDPSTGDPARRNPFYRVTASDSFAVIDPEESIEALSQRGVVLLACNMALMGRASTLAQKTKAPVDTVRDELRANLVPGVILQPNGIYAVVRAQEMGCALVSA